MEKQIENIFEPKIKIDADEIAKNYAENLRETLGDLKMKKADIHFENINPTDLTNEDLIIFDKLRKNVLTEEDFNSYRENLKNYFWLQRQIKKEQYDALKDSRSNFSAMIANKIMAKKAEEMIRERKFKKAA